MKSTIWPVRPRREQALAVAAPPDVCVGVGPAVLQAVSAEAAAAVGTIAPHREAAAGVRDSDVASWAREPEDVGADVV